MSKAPRREGLTSNDFGRAIGRTKLPPPVRFVFTRLALRVDWHTGGIPDGSDGTKDDRPSLTDLCAETGYCRTTIREALFVLEEEGWITRFPPDPADARRKHERTGYQLHYPGSDLMMATRERQTGPDHRARRRAMAEQVRAAKERHAAARAAAAAGKLPDWSTDAELVELARRVLQETTGREVDEDVGRATVRAVLGGKPRDHFTTGPGAYLDRSIRKEPRRYLPPRDPVPGPLPQRDVTPAAEIPAHARPYLDQVRSRRKG